jgi:16S rRNA (adenine1518-N6/adenine1519-N6)-dimethyltransferase
MGRRLGQHFLRPASVTRLLGVVDPKPDESFLEIGPGAGALTIPLCARAAHVTAVEVDARLAANLQRRAIPNLAVHNADALDADLAALAPPGTRLVGNLPYFISSPLLRRFLDLRGRVTDAHVMLQEEVARRVASPPGSKEYGILSVLFALWADVDIVLRFPPGAFLPPPKVHSAVIRIVFRPEPAVCLTRPEAFATLVARAFTQRRRTLENNLQDSYPNLKEHLRLLNIEGSRRAETLSVVEFGRLANALAGE